MRIKTAMIGLVSAATLLLAGCAPTAAGGTAGGTVDAYDVKLGYFPNLTHAPAIVGVNQGFFADELDAYGATVTTQTFNSGSDTVKALLGGGLDATFIGPSPAIAAYVTSMGDGVRVISGATSGGASLVVQPGIDSLGDLVGLKVATPGLGNTQDVAARHYFAENGFETDTDGGGDISIVPTDNGTTLQAFAQGELAGAWVPEPYASLLVAGGGDVLVDESELWQDGAFVTTQLLVSTQFLEQHPLLVEALLRATVDSVEFIHDDSDAAKAIVAADLFEITQTPLDPEVLDSAWGSLTFTFDPLADTLAEDARQADELGLLSGELPEISGLYHLGPLNTILAERGIDEVPTP
jgi:NitT/TauT family transport system substrate-binding protein